MPLNSLPSRDTGKCPNCGATLPTQAAQGLCPKCLFAGLAVPTESNAGSAAQVPVQTPEELTPHFPHLEILECLGGGGHEVSLPVQHPATQVVAEAEPSCSGAQ